MALAKTFRSVSGCDMRRLRNITAAFTLVEMAMVVLIIGLVMMIVFPALTAIRTATQRSVTENNMQAVMKAIAIYAQNYGCLPCPSLATTIGDNFGLVPAGTPTAACGKCLAQSEGIVPYVSLGIPRQFAKDGWGRWLTLRIDPGLSRDCLNDYNSFFCKEQKKGLCYSGAEKTRRVRVFQPGSSIGQPAAVMLVSHGANGWGAYQADAIGNGLGQRLPFPDFAPACNANAPATERCNADNNIDFAAGMPSPDPAKPFDDLLLYYDRNNLVSLAGNSSCAEAW